jgi:hypothetical protein
MLTDKRTLDLYTFTNKSFIPDEIYFSSIVHSIKNQQWSYPGACLSEYEKNNTRKQWISRLDIWTQNSCRGKLVRMSCVFGVGDLPKFALTTDNGQMMKNYHLTAHKMYLEYESSAYICLLQQHRRRTLAKETLSSDHLEYYRNLNSVRFSQIAQPDDWSC